MHPQSVVHALVAFRDGSIIAQLGPSDMRGADRLLPELAGARALPVARLDLAALGQLDFEPADPERFPALRLARRCWRSAGSAGADVLMPPRRWRSMPFSPGAIGFLDMAVLVEHVLEITSDPAAAHGPG